MPWPSDVVFDSSWCRWIAKLNCLCSDDKSVAIPVNLMAVRLRSDEPPVSRYRQGERSDVNAFDLYVLTAYRCLSHTSSSVDIQLMLVLSALKYSKISVGHCLHQKRAGIGPNW